MGPPVASGFRITPPPDTADNGATIPDDDLKETSCKDAMNRCNGVNGMRKPIIRRIPAGRVLVPRGDLHSIGGSTSAATFN